MVGAVVPVHLEVSSHGGKGEVVHLLARRGVRLGLRPLQVGLQLVDGVLETLDGGDEVRNDAVGRAHVVVESGALKNA